MSLLTALMAAALMQAPTSAPDLSWMAGYWLDCSGGREASETWSDPRAGLLVGHTVTVRNGRSGFEFARIAPLQDGVLAYVAQPGGAAPTPFRLIESGPQRVVFANPANDFPHRILYQREGDVLTARIEGADDDETRSAEWTFNKAELNARCPS
ncbi:DUF6265 family protein [Brevundimonas pondensis]|uniref:DUF6265 domain-containing protein n=1 Tax=Brevundimonas pondensis TaxID=2774189 RepID=A0ABX7SKP0_9CAUL|nr:DUF6265 family protein [Brevundimonas pondensis]QTC87392.1 hypothetical protein IFE19_15065 [Brevundimonas pondensis]